MSTKEDDFRRKLLETFRAEAGEHLAAMTSGLIDLEKALDPQRRAEIVEAVFREAHSLKGAARVVNKTKIEAACQEVETLFASLKENKIALTAELLDAIHRSLDALIRIHSAPESHEPKEPPAQPAKDHPLLKEPEAGRKDIEAVQEPAPSQIARSLLPKLTDTVRISTATLDGIFLQAEELLSAKLAARQRAVEFREMRVPFASWKKKWSKVLPDVRGMEQAGREDGGQKDQRIGKISDFLQWNSEFIKSVQSQIEEAEKAFKQDQRFLDAAVDPLLEDVKKVLMLPFASLLDMFPKFVRDLSRDRGKDIDLAIHGSQIEIDRRILEEIKDPLIHLVRNCVDHGIERREERSARGKPARGAIAIEISPKDGGLVEALISDDGAGIDIDAVRTAAVKANLISGDEPGKWSEQEALSLIFKSGVSTSPMINDLSGRGLGLAIVLEKVEKFGGKVAVENRPGKGTAFRLALPVTLAMSRGILVRVAEQLFLIPTRNVDKVMRVAPGDVKTVQNRETIQYDGQAVSLVRLGSVLGLGSSELDGKNRIHAVLISAGDKKIAFAVDQVENEQEVLIKGLGRQLARVKHIAAATVLGTGKMVPILNVADLMKSAVREPSSPPAPPERIEEGEKKRKSVLVVEDSITARTLIKNILEAAGYDVKTAVDGLDAFATMRTAPFDIVVSDVDMPRMNGFDLTAKIRSDQSFSELPVVLVTALESKEDRERGIDVGASAYLVKSSFDQSNLLEVIKRLIG